MFRSPDITTARKGASRILLAATLATAAVALLAVPSLGCQSAHASDIAPTDYCYQTDIAVTYNGVGALTNQPVRVEINASGMIGSQQLDPRAWDVKPIIGSFGNEVHLTAQDLTATDAAFWLVLPEISAGETRTPRLYTGSGEQRRNQGIYFTDQEKVVIPHDADFNITDRLMVSVSLANFSDTARNEIIVEHHDNAGGGYRIQFENLASALQLLFVTDSSNCRLVWDSSWTGTRQAFTFEYTQAAGLDAFITRNGASAATCDQDEGALGTTSNDVLIGETDGGTADLADAVIYDVEIAQLGPYTVSGAWSFNAVDMVETVGANPFEGTTPDRSGNGHTATYTFDRDQSDFSYSVSSTQLASSANQITLSDTNPDVLGGAFESLGATPRAENTTGAFYNVLIDQWADASPIRSFGYAMALSLLGLVMAIAIYRLTRYIPLALFVFGFPLAIGVANGWIAPWWMILWVIMAIAGWFAQRQSETA